MKICNRNNKMLNMQIQSANERKDDRESIPHDHVAIGQKNDEYGLIPSPSGKITGGNVDTKKAPGHLSRELLSRIEKHGTEAEGPYTAEQKKYLQQDFPKPWGTTNIASSGLFGMGGIFMPDSAGRIKHIALQFGNVEFDSPLPEKTEKALLNFYKTLFTSMESRTRFTIVAANEKGVNSLRQAVLESGMANPERVKIVNGQAEKGFSIWIRDSMIPVIDSNGSPKILIQDRTYWPGPEDARVPALIDEANDDVTSMPHPSLRIDGGNILSNQEYLIIGNDSVLHTTKRLQELFQVPEWKEEIIAFYEHKTGKEVIEDGPVQNPNQVTLEDMWKDIAPEVFKSEFQRKVYIIGQDNPDTPITEEQPVFHIDMAVTPIGNNRFLVGDPGMAIRILQNLTPTERELVNKIMAIEAGLPQDSDLIGKLIEVNGSQAHQANFDNVARELKEKGYEIERIPCLIGLRTTWSLPYLTYNNCIQENYMDESGNTVKKVYLPTYGCEPLETIAKQTYQNLGYEVIPLKMAAVSILEGAIRCSSYPLERTDV